QPRERPAPATPDGQRKVLLELTHRRHRSSLVRSLRALASPVMVVLFTCAGRRADIVAAFGAAGATTLATDSSELAPALYVADRRALVPRVDDPGYLPALAELVRVHGVELVVPLTDLDHRVLAARRDELDALVLLPDLPTV